MPIAEQNPADQTYTGNLIDTLISTVDRAEKITKQEPAPERPLTVDEVLDRVTKSGSSVMLWSVNRGRYSDRSGLGLGGKMKTRLLFVLAAVALFGGFAHGENQGSCLIVKHKGTIGRRLMWTALIGVPIAPGAKFDYVDSIGFSNSKMSYSGKALRDIEASGTHVVVLDRFSADELTAARQSCGVQTPESPKAPAPVVPVKVVTAAPSQEHVIEGYTISGPSTSASDPGSSISLGDAGRAARAKKAAEANQ
jgi:hypothetical protein